MWIFRRRPRPELPPKPAKPASPASVPLKEPIIVRSYKADGWDKEKKLAAMYEADARKLWADGYEPVLNAAQGPGPSALFLGPGFSQLKGGTLTVTYKLTQAEQARQQDLREAHEQAMARYASAKAAYDRDLAAWKAERKRILGEFTAAQKAARAAEKAAKRAE